MTVLASPRGEATSPTSSTTSAVSRKRQQNNVTSSLYPLIQHAIQFQQLISSAAFHLFVRTYFATYLVAYAALVTSRTIAWRTFIVFRIFISRALVVSKWLGRRTLSSIGTTRLRKRIEFELYVFLVGPCANMLFLMLFWPGWLVLGVAIWAYWQVAG